MEAIESNSHSVLQDSQITSENSICIAENVEGFQQCVKEILNLIEQDGNFPEMTPEIYDSKKSKLTTLVTELSRKHGVLADQHVHLIGELTKKQHLDSSDSSSPQVTQMFTPNQMSISKFRTPIGFDVLLSSGGGGSYASRIEGSESSFSLSSDSESESSVSINKLLISPINDDSVKVKENKLQDPDVLLKKISVLEEELLSLNTKLQTLADENSNLKHDINEKESDLQTQKAHLQSDKAKVSELKLVVADSNHKMETMGNELDASREKLSTAEDEISELKNEMLQKNLDSEQEMALLQKQIDSEKNKISELEEEVSLCVADISIRNDQITELNNKIHHFMSEVSSHTAKEETWNTDFKRLKTEVLEKCYLIEDLNHKHDSVMLERDGVKAQLDTVRAEMSSRDDKIRELETRLGSLEADHERVVLSFDNAKTVANDLKLKVVELEKEAERQREVLSDRAEEKREAIRQLSFSLEHYMSGYKELRQAFVGNKIRRAVLTS